ncbi:MAG: tail fiber domain-containing protein, partial [bacterium]
KFYKIFSLLIQNSTFKIHNFIKFSLRLSKHIHFVKRYGINYIQVKDLINFDNSHYSTSLGFGAGRVNWGNHNTFIGYQAGFSNTSGYYNSAMGYLALFSNTTGNYNSAMGDQAGYNCKGSGNLFLGYQAGYHETGSNTLYIDNSDTSHPLIYGEFDNDIVKINGKLGVGTTPGTYRLTLPNTANDLGKGIANAWETYSSRRWKTNITPIENPLDKVFRLRGVYFN